jgi:Fic family protein
MEFFLTGVAETAEQASETARELITLFGDHRQRIATLGRAAPSALRVHEFLQGRPIVTIQAAANALEMTFPTVSTALDKLAGLDIVSETTGKQRGRIYVYTEYLALLDRGTEPLPA